MMLIYLIGFPLLLHLTECEVHSGRIVNGTETTIRLFPYMVSVRLIPEAHICGGTILSPSFVLTAASCFLQLQSIPALFVISAGIDDISTGNSSFQQTRNITQIIVHPNYTATPSYENNLALIQLGFPLIFDNSFVSNAEMSTLTSFNGLELFTLGWGLTNRVNQSGTVNKLQFTTVYESTACNFSQSASQNTQFCASGKNMLYNVCFNMQNLLKQSVL